MNMILTGVPFLLVLATFIAVRSVNNVGNKS